MNRFFRVMLIIIGCSLTGGLLTVSLSAQATPVELAYGAMRQALIEPDAPIQSWRFAAEARDMVQITVQRIGGQFVPRLRLLTPDGAELAVSQPTTFRDTAVLVYEAGLPSAGLYQIEISGEGLFRNLTENPDEYLVTLDWLGQQRSDPNADLTPLPALGLAAPPELESGSPNADNLLRLPLYGEAVVERPDARNAQNRFTITRGDQQLVILNADPSPVVPALDALSMQDFGSGFIASNSQLQRAVFFTDQEFTLTYDAPNSTYTIALANGQTIITDFYRVTTLQAVNGLIAAQLVYTNTAGETQTRRALFDNQRLTLRQRRGQSVNAAPINEFLFEDGRYFYTDLRGWETAAYLGGELRVLLDLSQRFITDLAQVELRAAGDTLADYQIIQQDGANFVTFQLDWISLGEVRVQQGEIRLIYLDGRTLRGERTDTTRAVLIEAGAARFERLNQRNQFRLALPDGTEIETPIDIRRSTTALPHENGFTPHGANNLGSSVIPACYCPYARQISSPVNPANGNWHLAITDLHLPAVPFPLTFSRYYNSQDSGLTPAYMTGTPYSYGQLGIGWRHSFQYELDLTLAPLDEITLLLPEGARHVFRPEGAPNRYRARALLNYTLYRDGGLLGSWRLIRTDGLTFWFDRAGRLERIAFSADHALSLVLRREAGSATALYVVDPYGRRLELHVNAFGRITRVRDPLLRDITYTYDAQNVEITGVTYGDPAQTAAYRYNDDAVLTSLDDVRSPLAQRVSLVFDDRRRVVRYIENPASSAPRTTSYAYNDSARQTQRSLTVGVDERVTLWTFSERYQLTQLALPRPDVVYEYLYDPTTEQLTRLRQPTRSTYQLRFDERGQLIALRDPIFTSELDSYALTYLSADDRTALSEITYPGDSLDTFEYDFGQPGAPRLLAHTRLIRASSNPQTRQTATTRYEYDALGRVILVAAPGIDAQPSGTAYMYDEFGYVAEIWQGIALAEGETYATLTPERAQRILRFDYDLAGQLRAIQANDALYTLSYDATTGRLRQVLGPQGIALTYAYDARGNLIEVNDRGQITRYTYDLFDRLLSMTNILGETTRYAYDEAGNLLSVTDALNRQQQYAYDALDSLMTLIDVEGQTTRYETTIDTTANRIERRATFPSGEVITWRYDPLGRLTRVTQNAGNQEYLIEYNPVGLPTSIRENFTARTLTMTYDLAGRMTTIDLAGAAMTFAYDPAGNLITITSPDRPNTSFAYDRLGQITSVTLPDESTTRYAYDASGRLTSTTDATGDSSRLGYDGLGQMIEQTLPTGARTLYRYDGRGNLIEQVDALGRSTRYDYDALDRLAALTDPNDAQTLYTYDAAGRLTEILSPEGRSTRYSYDALDHLITQTIAPLQLRTLYSYDVAGRLASITDPLGHTTTYEYTGFGELARITDATGNTATFDWNNGNLRLAGYTDFAGRRFQFLYDALGRLETVRDLTDEASSALHTTLAYTAAGAIERIQTATDRARIEAKGDITHTITYDALGRPLLYRLPNGTTRSYTYDALGRLVRVTDVDGRVTTYAYDAAGRIRDVERDPGTASAAQEQYEYDAVGNLIGYTAPDGSTNRYSYDANRHLIQAILADATPDERRFHYAYNDLGQLAEIVDAEGQTTRYIYALDQLARMIRVFNGTTIETRYSYDGNGSLSSITAPDIPGADPAVGSLTYDSLNRRVRYTDATRNVWAYTYDRAGNVTQISDPLGSVYRYTYNNDDQLTSIGYPDGTTLVLGYNTSGQLSSITPPGLLPMELARDLAGHIRQITQGETTLIADTIDAASQRVFRREQADGSAQCYDYDAAGRITAITYYEPNQPCGSALGILSVLRYTLDAATGRLLEVEREGVEPYTYRYDAAGRVIEAVSPGVTLRYTYDRMGNLLARDAGEYGITRYTYDERYRPTQIVLGEDSVTLRYDARDQLTELSRSNGIITTYNYDAAGRVTRVLHRRDAGDILDGFNYQYNAAGNLIGIDRLSDGWRILYSYDARHRLIEERWLNANGETVYTLTVRYDAAGNRASITRNGQTATFTYDAQGRLITETRPATVPLATATALVLAVLPLRRRWLLLIVMALVFVAGWAVTQGNPPLTTLTYSYDASGKLVAMIAQPPTSSASVSPFRLTFQYDTDQRLIGIRGQGADGRSLDTRWTYHDVTGQPRFWRATAEERTDLIFDGAVLMAARRITSVSSEQELYLGLANGERLLTMRPDGSRLWALNDAFGAPRLYTDAAGNLLPDARLDYTSMGELLNLGTAAPAAPAALELTPLFMGYLYDPSTRLYQLDGRAFDSLTARFLQPAAPGADFFNPPYTYAADRPFYMDAAQHMWQRQPDQPAFQPAVLAALQPPAIPQPGMAADPPPSPRTAEMQQAAFYRAWQIYAAAYEQLNPLILGVSPRLDQVLFLSDPALAQPSLSPAERIAALHQAGRGWQPMVLPDARQPVDPWLALLQADELLRDAYARPFGCCATALPDWPNLQPRVLPPDPLPRALQAESALPDLLRGLNNSAILANELAALRAALDPQIAPPLPFPTVTPPRITIDPAALPEVQIPRLTVPPPS